MVKGRRTRSREHLYSGATWIAKGKIITYPLANLGSIPSRARVTQLNSQEVQALDVSLDIHV